MHLDGGPGLHIQEQQWRQYDWSGVRKIEGSRSKDQKDNKIVTLEIIVMTLAFILVSLRSHWAFCAKN